MKILTKDDFRKQRENILKEISDGAVFIYPTDTIYGIGCNAALQGPVTRIREMKQRKRHPFSVIAPSAEWIRSNCIVSQEGEDWIAKLPVPYTLIFSLKEKDAVAGNVTDRNTLGIRIPDHWLTRHLQTINLPIISTSANKTSEMYMTSLEDLDTSLRAKVDFIIYEGKKDGSPSTIVHLNGQKTHIRGR